MNEPHAPRATAPHEQTLVTVLDAAESIIEVAGREALAARRAGRDAMILARQTHRDGVGLVVAYVIDAMELHAALASMFDAAPGGLAALEEIVGGVGLVRDFIPPGSVIGVLVAHGDGTDRMPPGNGVFGWPKSVARN